MELFRQSLLRQSLRPAERQALFRQFHVSSPFSLIFLLQHTPFHFSTAPPLPFLQQKTTWNVLLFNRLLFLCPPYFQQLLSFFCFVPKRRKRFFFFGHSSEFGFFTTNFVQTML